MSSNFLQQPSTPASTRDISELLILGALAHLQRATLANLHEALIKATQATDTVFFLGQPLRAVLDKYRHLNYVRLVPNLPEPTYEITASGQARARLAEDILNDHFPRLSQMHA